LTVTANQVFASHVAVNMPENKENEVRAMFLLKITLSYLNKFVNQGNLNVFQWNCFQNEVNNN